MSVNLENSKKTNKSKPLKEKTLGEEGQQESLPLLILPNMVLFPEATMVLTSQNNSNLNDLSAVMKKPIRFGVVTGLGQKSPKSLSQLKKGLSLVGTEGVISSIARLQNGEMGAIIKGERRFEIKGFQKTEAGFSVKPMYRDDDNYTQTVNFSGNVKALKDLTLKMVKLNPSITPETAALLGGAEDPSLLGHLVSPYLSISLEEKLSLLTNFSLKSRTKLLIKFVSRELELLQISNKIQKNLQNDLQDKLRKNFLQEQLIAIKKELGDDEEGDEIEELQKEIDALPMPDDVKVAAEKELDRLDLMSPGSPEYMVSWSYLTCLTELPWGPVTTKKSQLSLEKTKKTLDSEHYGLDKVKERVVEYIAVLKHKGKHSGQILLLSGAPGVGKTSLGKSIAKSLGLPFAKISLGGVKDESEIRGHRRTYIGSMPGKIITALKEVQSTKAVVLLDEIDKVGGDHHGDLSSALLEVLDPEQNKKFVDHYLSVPYDLSDILFVATANNPYDISAPLLDRMELVEIPGYAEQEKIKIALKYAIPQIRKELKLNAKQFSLSEPMIRLIIRNYTKEVGVRQLKRQLTAIARKIVTSLVAKSTKVDQLSLENLFKYLGPPKYMEEPFGDNLPVGVGIGLAYTTHGGDILYVEARKVKSLGEKGKVILTGSLGKVMQESAQTCLSYLIAHADSINLEREDVEKSDIHLHFPDGATPKDGPSAGCIIFSTLVSLFLSKPIPSSLVMTGEITLRGDVLPVGGIHEKVIAAHRYGKKQVILPYTNWFDLHGLPKEVTSEVEFYPVKNMEEVLLVAGLIEKKKKVKPKKYSKRSMEGRFKNFSEWSTIHI